MAEDIQYRNARIDNSENTVEIKTVYDEFLKDYGYRGKHVFHCPCCGLEMEAVLGEIRKKHFRHKGTPCGYNNFLHSTAEEVFFEEYKKCLDRGIPFEISVYPEVQCDPSCIHPNKRLCPRRHKDKVTIDLTRIYKKITPEERVYIDGRFRRPDLLLESESGKMIMVEIWVSHETGEEKRKQGRILEIKIASEDDIDKIRTHRLVQSKPSDNSIRLFVWDEVCSDPDLPRDYAEEDSDTLSGGTGGSPGQSQEQIWPRLQAPLPPLKPTSPPVDLTPTLDLASLSELSYRDIPYWKRDKGPEWVNLSLPSGTVWSKEYMGSMTFEEAQRAFPNMIPSLEQYLELASSCETTRPYPAGFIGPNGALMEMYEGDFWTALSLDESRAVAFHRYNVQKVSQDKRSLSQSLGFVKANKGMRLCVRLVKKIK